MSQAYLRYYGFKREPFIADIPRDELLKTPMIKEVQNRIEYVIRLGSIGLITGDVGCGKSTALRQTAGELHPSKYKVLWITGSPDHGRTRDADRQIFIPINQIYGFQSCCQTKSGSHFSRRTSSLYSASP